MSVILFFVSVDFRVVVTLIFTRSQKLQGDVAALYRIKLPRNDHAFFFIVADMAWDHLGWREKRMGETDYIVRINLSCLRVCRRDR